MQTRVVLLLGRMVLASVLVAGVAYAQQMPPHDMPMSHGQPMGQTASSQPGVPTSPGQGAFAAIQEIVRILEDDPTTDWSKVSLERLRQHLIDMNEVTLRAEVKSAAVPGGLAMDVTGTGRTRRSIRAMVGPHANELNQMKEWAATVESIPNGLRLTVVAKDPTDAKTVARIRGLGFIGLLVQGAHHQPHHLAMAKGEKMPGHGH
jgi:hypothetical protein